MFDYSDKEQQYSIKNVKKEKRSEPRIHPVDQSPSHNVRIVQKKRKVVSKVGPSIEDAILWDNRQHKYFKNMRAYRDDGTSDHLIHKIKTGEDQRGETAGHFDSENHMYYGDAADKDKIGLNEELLEWDEAHFVETNKNTAAMGVYDGGEQVNAPKELFSIRLYAEGNMDHARGLAGGMDRYLRQGNPEHSIFPLDKMQGKKVLIKATEFRRLQEVAEAYRPSEFDSLIGEEATTSLQQWAISEVLADTPNLEGAFGGNTGDMTRIVTDGNHRKYDLIQTTFFWIQGYKRDEIEQAKEREKQEISVLNRQIQELQRGINRCNNIEKEHRNNEIAALSTEIQNIKKHTATFCNMCYREGNERSYQMMLDFVREQLKKLNPGGELRIVVSDAEPYAQICLRLDDFLRDIIANAADDNFYPEITLDIRTLDKTYPEQLAEEGLNDVGFEQRQTQKLSTVSGRAQGAAIVKDLIIIIKRKN